MNYNYKRTFDALRMSPQRQEQIRSALSSHVRGEQDEANKMRRRPRIAAVIAIAALALSTTVGFAYGPRLVALLGGGTIEHGINEDGDNYASVSTGFETNPAEVRDGRVHFVMDGSDLDITDFISDEDYYQYESIDSDGCRHIIFIGGEPDALGWAEFVWDKNGEPAGGSSSYSNTEDGEVPTWLKNASESIGWPI